MVSFTAWQHTVILQGSQSASIIYTIAFEASRSEVDDKLYIKALAHTLGNVTDVCLQLCCEMAAK